MDKEREAAFAKYRDEQLGGVGGNWDGLDAAHFRAGFDAGYNAREAESVKSWLPINRENKSLRWLLLLDRINGTGRQGLRLGRPEDTGWRLIDEYGRSTWQSHAEGFYLAEMPLSVPTDAPYTEDK